MPTQVNHTRHVVALVASFVIFAVLATNSGCEPTQPNSVKSARPSAASIQRRSERGDVLFKTVVEQLRNLPSFVDTELQPPLVILDSKSSSDGQDVLATCGVFPGTVEGPINCITVDTNNGRFRSLGVRPGDVLKYYVLLDDESAEAGITQIVSTDLMVAQVLNDNALLIEGGLRLPVTEPAKIEIWRYSDERLIDIARAIAIYKRYGIPAFDWEPSPDNRVLKQITERLNQWMRQSQPNIEWSVDPLLATLDPTLASDKKLAPLIAVNALGDSVIQPDEGRRLQEAVWLRDIGRWAQGESFDDVARATALFDWTVRNIQLDADHQAKPYRPWEVLLYGHGTAEQRAWVFALLCRQLGLDVVVLELPETASQPSEDAASSAKFWLPALWSDGKLYLFDARLGLPIPGKNGLGIATLADVEADIALLRQLDLDDAPYAVAEDQLKNVTVNLVADSFDLSRRAATIQSKLSGDDRLTLAVAPSKLADALKAMPEISSVKLWDMPYRMMRTQLTIPESRDEAVQQKLDPVVWRGLLAQEFEPFAWRPTLWKARALHFQGRREGDVDSPTADPDQIVDDQAEAIGLYTSPLVRPPERVLTALSSEPKRKIYSAAKDSASYWVGLLLFDQGKFASAEDWFRDPRLAAAADGTWVNGTRYNLARTYEAEGKFPEAIALYEADTSPQQNGNRLRARRLKNRPQTAQPPAENPDT